ncbi:MAG: insulinase family protein [Oscillospiraceae bacterium]|nr:insulinase family protein [Oscillospiraceae bacterium]
MELTRTQIMPGVWLSHLRTEKFKTACLSLTLLTQLQRETASLNALIPYVLRRGTIRYPDMGALYARMEELYGAAIAPVVRRIGEIQCLGFYASIPEGAFLPEGRDLLRDAVSLLGEMLLSPATRGGLLLPQYVDSEREKMLEAIRSRLNDKRSYAMQRCVEEMCCYESYAVSRLGDESSCEAIRYQKLTRQYHSLLQQSPVEIFYCGRARKKELVSLLRDALSTLPRGEIDDDIGTDVRMNALEAAPRFVEETMDVGQGKLAIGWRLGECMEEPDLAALQVFNAVFGGGGSSKLFRKVREERGLCYYADSMLESHKGLLLVSAGIDSEALDAVREEIFAQLRAMAEGDISDEELRAAKAAVASDLRALCDSQGELEGFYLSQILDGSDCGPLELAALVEDVSREDLVQIARSVDLDLIYLLKSGGTEEEDGD